jgi:hypothetical protein
MWLTTVTLGGGATLSLALMVKVTLPVSEFLGT